MRASPPGAARSPFSIHIDVRPRVASSIEAGRPVVALETTVLTHGIPRPANLDLAIQMDAEVTRAGALPATIGVLDGRAVVGMGRAEVERLCTDPAVRKLNRRDLAPAVALGWTGGTTVSATMFLAHLAGIRVFATGGIGGVHRGRTGDVSTDLTELARTPVAVVCSGAKSILDLPATLEWLETVGVPVVGYQTDTFPEFFGHGSGLPVSARVESAREAASLIRAQLATGSSVLLCVPCPEADAVDSGVLAELLEKAEVEARREGIGGKALTPYLLGRLTELTSGATLKANLALLLKNAQVAGEVAVDLDRHLAE